MRFKRLSALSSAFVLSFASLLAIVFPQVAHAAANTLYWCGANNANFSTAGNWNSAANCGGTAATAPPGTQSGGDGNSNDVLIFNLANNTSGSLLIANDDITNLTVASVEFTGGSAGVIDAYTIGGTNTLNITGGITDNSLTDSSTTNQFANIVDVGSAVTFNISTGSSELYEELQGAGNITVAGGGTATFGTTGSGSSLASYTGTISSSDGSIVQLENDLSGTYSSSGTVAVSGTSVLDLLGGSCKTSCTYNYNLPISLGGSGTGKDCALNLDGYQDTNITNDFSGTVTLTSNICVTSTGITTIDFTGPINFGSYYIKSPVSPPIVTINVASGTDYSSENPNIGQNVTYFNDGTVGNTTVYDGGLLKGNGTLASADVQSGGTIAPGHSPGCLTVTGDFTLAGSLTEDIQSPGSTACTDYDQVVVSGTVNLTNGSLNTEFLNGFTPSVGQSYEIIKNQGSSPVTGTFSGLAEGAVFAVGNTKLQITYKGAGGNNVVLTVVSLTTPTTATPGTPNTGFGLTSSHVALPILGGLLMASGLLMISRKVKLTTRRS